MKIQHAYPIQALVAEPQFQSKKRLDGPSVSLSADYYKKDAAHNPSEEYTLLGQNEKFASNVKYRPKTRVQPVSSPRDNGIEKEKPSQNTVVIKPAPVVNTAKFSQSSIPPTPLAPREVPPPAANTKSVQTLPPEKKGKENKPQPVKRAAKDDDVSAPMKSSVKDDSVPVKQARKADMKVTKGNYFQEKQALKDKNLSDVLGEMIRKKSRMNEFAQTNMEKNVMDSGPEATAEYALKYKAKVVPPRPGRKQSEYQREFEWKNMTKNSPLLAADQLVYKSRVGPVRTGSFPKSTEYKAQFKKWKMVENEPVPAVKHAAQQKEMIQRLAMKRSKSVGAIDRKRLDKVDNEIVQDANTLAEISKHHGKLRKVVTEYNSNFKSPQKFLYDKGAWHGASPPHLYTRKEDIETAKPAGSWYDEVLELRHRAEEYKKRAQGTHFSREHLVQLMARQTDFWDVSTSRTESSSTLSALSLEIGNGQPQITKKQSKSRQSFSERNNVDFASCMATIDDTDNASEPGEQVKEKKSPIVKNSRKMAWIEDQLNRAEEQVDESESGGQQREGRLPTPEWRKSKTPMKNRHHLDRTTPSVGGALLTSPEPVKSCSNFSVCSSESEQVNTVLQNAGKTYNLNNVKMLATFGLPSMDTHCLRDDDASMDRPLHTNYVYTPPDWVQELEDQESYEPVTEAPRRSQFRKRDKSRPAGVPSTLREQMADTYNVKPPLLLLPTDDCNVSVLSDSVRSIASSCSLASDVYERAKDRQNFWSSSRIAAQ